MNSLRASGSLDLQGTAADRFSFRIDTTMLEIIARPMEFILNAAFPGAALSSAAGEVCLAICVIFRFGFEKRTRSATALFLKKTIKIIKITTTIKLITSIETMNIIVTYSNNAKNQDDDTNPNNSCGYKLMQMI